MKNEISFVQSYKAGFITAIIASILNSSWNFIAQSGLGIQVPSISWIEITFISLAFIIIASCLYYLLVRYLPKGKLFFIIIVIVYTLPSCYTLLNYEILPNGSLAPDNFPVLSIPMFLISGALVLWGIPKFSK